jgi:hypothetical protein
MKSWTRFLALALCAAFLPMMAAACGSGDDSGGDDKATATRSARADDDTPEADASPTKRAGKTTPKAVATLKAAMNKTQQAGAAPTKRTGSKTATPEKSTGPSGDAAIDLDSFHYQVEISFSVVGEGGAINGSIEGDYVAPDSHSYQQTFSLGGISGSEAVIIIGDDAWQREGEGDWSIVDRLDLDTDLTSADDEFIADAQFIDDIAALDSEESDVDGRPARKYAFTKDDIEAITDILGEGFLSGDELADIEDFSFVIWVDEDRDVILRAELEATALASVLGDTGLSVDPGQFVTISLILHLSDVNDKGIEIEPPI